MQCLSHRTNQINQQQGLIWQISEALSLPGEATSVDSDGAEEWVNNTFKAIIKEDPTSLQVFKYGLQ